MPLGEKTRDGIFRSGKLQIIPYREGFFTVYTRFVTVATVEKLRSYSRKTIFTVEKLQSYSRNVVRPREGGINK